MFVILKAIDSRVQTSLIPYSSIPNHFHVSFRVNEPEAGVVNILLGSDSHVIAPLNLRMYLYSIEVLAGKLIVTALETS